MQFWLIFLHWLHCELPKFLHSGFIHIRIGFKHGEINFASHVICPHSFNNITMHKLGRLWSFFSSGQWISCINSLSIRNWTFFISFRISHHFHIHFHSFINLFRSFLYLYNSIHFYDLHEITIRQEFLEFLYRNLQQLTLSAMTDGCQLSFAFIDDLLLPKKIIDP